MEFKTAFNRYENAGSPTGAPESLTYTENWGENGHRELVVSGLQNDYALIQSFADETDINNIITRAKNGDVRALNKNKGYYLDTTEMPKTRAEWEKMRLFINSPEYTEMLKNLETAAAAAEQDEAVETTEGAETNE